MGLGRCRAVVNLHVKSNLNSTNSVKPQMLRVLVVDSFVPISIHAYIVTKITDKYISGHCSPHNQPIPGRTPLNQTNQIMLPLVPTSQTHTICPRQPFETSSSLQPFQYPRHIFMGPRHISS